MAAWKFAWKFTVEYDGSRYAGWQEQKNAPRTVLGALRHATESVLETPLEMHGAGRTDAGVHALGQVLHVKGNPRRAWKPLALLNAVNDALGHDIAVLAVEEVPERFHARHHAEARQYLYRISLRKNAFAKRHVWWCKDRLDTAVMQQAAPCFVGRHDFSAFRAEDPGKAADSPIVVVEAATLERVGDELHFRIRASHFLWRQVRRMVGALVRLGTADLSLNDLQAAVDGDQRWQPQLAAWTAPAAGLYLEAVRYPDDLTAAIKPPRQAASRPGKDPAPHSRERPPERHRPDSRRRK